MHFCLKKQRIEYYNHIVEKFLKFCELIICVFVNNVLFLQSVLKNIQKTL